MMGSSPIKQKVDNTQIGTTLETYTHHPTEVNVSPSGSTSTGGYDPASPGVPGASSVPPGGSDSKFSAPSNTDNSDNSRESKNQKKNNKSNNKKNKKRGNIKEENKNKSINDKNKIEKGEDNKNENTTKKTIGNQKKDKKRNYDDEYIPQSTFGPGENPNINRAEGDYSHESRDMIPATQKGKEKGLLAKSYLGDGEGDKKLSLQNLKEKTSKGNGGKSSNKLNFSKIKGNGGGKELPKIEIKSNVLDKLKEKKEEITGK